MLLLRWCPCSSPNNQYLQKEFIMHFSSFISLLVYIFSGLFLSHFNDILVANFSEKTQNCIS